MSRSPYTKTKWIILRNHVLYRDNHKCKKCGSDEGILNVHHLAYINNKQIYEVHPDLLMTLCKKCHSHSHSNKKMYFNNEEEALTYVRETFGVTPGDKLKGKIIKEENQIMICFSEGTTSNMVLGRIADVSKAEKKDIVKAIASCILSSKIMREEGIYKNYHDFSLFLYDFINKNSTFIIYEWNDFKVKHAKKLDDAERNIQSVSTIYSQKSL